MQPYDTLAVWYDQLMEDVPYERWARRIAQLLKRLGPQPKKLLELAAGTGGMTAHLLAEGHWITAVERSEPMLQEAVAALGNGGGRLKLISAPMEQFDTAERFDAVLAVCDGFNYLESQAALRDMLARCAHLCRPGGLILFDLSTDWKFRHQLHQTVIAENHEDMAFIWENEYDPRTRVLDFDLTFFVREGALFRRETEHHRQRAHSPEEIAGCCEALGLVLEGVYDGYTDEPAREDSERIHCVIRKN